MKSKVLFIIPDQYGYAAGYNYYCKYLSLNGFDVTILCQDRGFKKIYENNGNIIYISSNSNIRLFNAFQRLYYTVKNIIINRNKFDVFVLKHVNFILLYRFLLIYKTVYLDIRTASVSPSKIKRLIFDSLMKFDTFFFKKVFILSQNLRKQLKLSTNKTIFLPLGADELSKNAKDYSSSMKFLYIGTFNNRNIEVMLGGFKIFYLKYKNKINISLDIIGYGNNENEIIKIISSDIFDHNIQFHGRLTHLECKYLFEKCNYGISFVPQTSYFDNQPPTKTYEYILSGLACLATKTSSNIQLISENNGVLCEDKENSFADALEEAYRKRHEYTTDKIKKTLSNYTWKYIVENIMIQSFLKK